MNAKQTGGMVLLAAALLGIASGCIAVGGTETQQTPTLGRQLIDLKQARDTGAISDEQFQQAQANLLARSR